MPDVDWDQLFARAMTIRDRAHAPYSNFRVGAALLADDGQVYVGCNVENASYGLAVCAERNAIASMVAAGAKRPLGIAIVADSKPPCPPCGMCRQVLAEFAPQELSVRCRNLQAEETKYTLGELLPHAFTGEFL